MTNVNQLSMDKYHITFDKVVKSIYITASNVKCKPMETKKTNGRIHVQKNIRKTHMSNSNKRQQLTTGSRLEKAHT